MPSQTSSNPSTNPLWFRPAPRRQHLADTIDADVVIVGAGYTGLWTTYYLLKARPSLRVVLIERNVVGFGASGRNGGWASAIFPISLSRVAQMYSHEAALHLQAAMNATVDEIGQVLETENLDADFQKEGFISLARSDAQLLRVLSAVEASTRFGLPAQWQILDSVVAREKVGARDVIGALYTEHCAVIHPGKLVHGLAKLVESMGARIYENSEVKSIRPGIVSTANGTVKAETVVRATEAFSCQQSENRRSVIPLSSLVLATEPLPLDMRRRLHLDHRLAFNDMRHLRVYGQVTADGRLVFGGRGAPYKWGSTISDDFGDAHDKIRKSMVGFFPELADVAITHRWGGALGVARDWCPTVSMDKRTRIAWAGNYVGDGVATSNLAGRILSNLILDVDEKINSLPFVNHQSPSWEAEPLRWFGINGGLFAAGLSDLEEKLTNHPSRTAMLMEKLTGAH
ncbi:FAD-dependent oxidoreductase [Burkholderia sp. A9]|nr:FAD-dependent oxidoreductase [Burkholderia sp. A9]